ncbi:hypothetical protein KPH14_012843 [Odynerus spinipes]|uniref:DUF7041 domain-containing protein n=1 Tax=Odynerus spinipes TaxID=1348599 RepID=A0AAD9REA5_9HYME|nr:hypothetical protein KPH14_012843 [Odynerus spinipes]
MSTENSAVGIHIPKFVPEKPTLWFLQLEAQFALRNITQDDTKYWHVIAQLEAHVVEELEDILTSPPTQDKYQNLKQEIIKRFTPSKDSRMQKLMEHEEMGDRTPSQFFRYLKNLAGNDVPEEFLRTVWLNRLPTSMQSILVAQGEAKIEKLTSAADRISERLRSPANRGTLAAVTDVDALARKIAAVAVEQRKPRQVNYRQRSKSPNRSNQQRRDRSSSAQRRRGLCWYHWRFKDKANRCVPPCTYNETGNYNQGR